MNGPGAAVTLIGRTASLRKLETRGKYEAMAFDLEIGDVQSWPCAAFGRAAGQLRRLKDGSWVRLQGEIADLTLERARRIGIKVAETLVMPEPKPRVADARLACIELNPAGQAGWLEIVDSDDLSWALEGAPDRLLDAVREFEVGAKVRARFHNLAVLIRFQGELRPIMTSVLDRLEPAQLALAAA